MWDSAIINNNDDVDDDYYYDNVVFNMRAFHLAVIIFRCGIIAHITVLIWYSFV